jgi:hypothetical protein
LPVTGNIDDWTWEFLFASESAKPEAEEPEAVESELEERYRFLDKQYKK